LFSQHPVISQQGQRDYMCQSGAAGPVFGRVGIFFTAKGIRGGFACVFNQNNLSKILEGPIVYTQQPRPHNWLKRTEQSGRHITRANTHHSSFLTVGNQTDHFGESGPAGNRSPACPLVFRQPVSYSIWQEDVGSGGMPLAPKPPNPGI